MSTMEFSIGDTGKILDILRSKIYSNPIQTLVQEYVCNARDAHREVSQTRKIDVTIPTKNSLMLSIRDYGPGISPERMPLFTSYGSTTKAGDASVTGGFGLGSKIGWAYTDTFYITTYIDGIKREYSASVATNKNGVLSLCSETPTTEPNGTCISIPIKSDKDIQEFQYAYDRAVGYWIDSERPDAYIQDKITIGSVDIYSIAENYRKYRSIAVAIDGIPYELSYEYINKHKDLKDIQEKQERNTCLVFHVGNKQASIAASRESISEDDALYALLIPQIQSMLSTFDAYVNTTVVGTLAERIEAYKHLKRFISIDSHGEIHTDGYSDNVYLKSHDYACLSLDFVEVRQRNVSKIRTKADNKKLYLNNKTIVVNDGKLSQAKAYEALALTFQHNTSNIILVSQGGASDACFASLLLLPGAIKLSDTVLPTKERKSREVIPDRCIKAYRVFSGSMGDLEIIFSDADVVVYIPEQDKKFNRSVYRLALNYIRTHLGACSFVEVRGVRNLNAIKKFKYAIPFEKVLADITKDEGMIGAHCKNIINDSIISNYAHNMSNPGILAQIEDTTFVAMLNNASHYMACERNMANVDGADLVLSALDNTLQAIACRALCESFVVHMEDTYPFLKHIPMHRDASEDHELQAEVKRLGWASEILCYLNGKYRRTHG